MIAKSHRWQKTAIAAAAIALVSLSASSAWALSLGRITVQSALGEPLRAEIDVLDINAEEASSLKAGVASPEAFAAAGLEYNAAMSSLKASLQRRADGRPYIQLVSDKAITDPFVDMIVEASWSSGRILRDYTMLFDPPALKKPAAAAPTLAQSTTSTPASTSTSAPAAPVAIAPAPAATPAPAPRAVPAPAKPAVTATPSAPARMSAPAVQADSSKQVTVKPGDTAGKIAAAVKPDGVSLDQMLVALLRSNPDSFINNNINRIRAGSVMDIPSKEQASAISAGEATQTVLAQSKDFNEFRRNLAGHAPAAAPAEATRKASGSVDTKVEDKKTAAPTPDKLTLSKGGVKPKTDEAKIAKERADKEAAARSAELNKNISDLKKLGAATTPAAPVVSAPSVTKPAASAPTITAAPAAASAPASTPAKPVSAPVAAPTASAPASAAASAPASAPTATPTPAPSTPVAAKPKAPVMPAPAEPIEPPGLLDDLLDNPWLPYLGGGLLLALGGFAAWRIRQRKQGQSHMDSSFLESRLQPDSFFGASGGQRVDTANESGVSGSSMVYSASQLDAADDVDPVAEADVYLAYGRDVQAEEILREALRVNPSRLAVYTKLLEIYAKRRDTKNYEAVATQAYPLTGANGPDWNRICEMGMGIDPTNKLYQPGGAPAAVATQPLNVPPATSSFGSTMPESGQAELAEPAGAMDLDLDLDFSLDDPNPSSAQAALSEATSPISEPTAKLPALDGGNGDMDMDLSLPDEPQVEAPALEMPPSAAIPTLNPEPLASNDGMSLSLDDHAPSAPASFGATAPMEVEAPAAQPTPASNEGMLEFDLGSLSLDLDSSTPAHAEAPTAAPASTEDPLETKLALAEEFVSIGDEDGARALIEEVVAEATGEMRAKAQRALAKLN
ncbi:MAG: FimV/HubP family polar landmark protein [Rhodoferax sp.]